MSGPMEAGVGFGACTRRVFCDETLDLGCQPVGDFVSRAADGVATARCNMAVGLGALDRMANVEVHGLSTIDLVVHSHETHIRGVADHFDLEPRTLRGLCEGEGMRELATTDEAARAMQLVGELLLDLELGGTLAVALVLHEPLCTVTSRDTLAVHGGHPPVVEAAGELLHDLSLGLVVGHALVVHQPLGPIIGLGAIAHDVWVPTALEEVGELAHDSILRGDVAQALVLHEPLGPVPCRDAIAHHSWIPGAWRTNSGRGWCCSRSRVLWLLGRRAGWGAPVDDAQDVAIFGRRGFEPAGMDPPFPDVAAVQVHLAASSVQATDVVVTIGLGGACADSSSGQRVPALLVHPSSFVVVFEAEDLPALGLPSIVAPEVVDLAVLRVHFASLAIDTANVVGAISTGLADEDCITRQVVTLVEGNPREAGHYEVS
mmetsp:Transcript_79999/g.175495  ORF Transcript_79999/g.175495 Transcript_79999/m.175495 type:complete len:431 (-) Transcript_79999:75-1367(-)